LGWIFFSNGSIDVVNIMLCGCSWKFFTKSSLESGNWVWSGRLKGSLGGVTFWVVVEGWDTVGKRGVQGFNLILATFFGFLIRRSHWSSGVGLLNSTHGKLVLRGSGF